MTDPKPSLRESIEAVKAWNFNDWNDEIRTHLLTVCAAASRLRDAAQRARDLIESAAAQHSGWGMVGERWVDAVRDFLRSLAEEK